MFLLYHRLYESFFLFFIHSLSEVWYYNTTKHLGWDSLCVSSKYVRRSINPGSYISHNATTGTKYHFSSDSPCLVHTILFQTQHSQFFIINMKSQVDKQSTKQRQSSPVAGLDYSFVSHDLHKQKELLNELWDEIVFFKAKREFWTLLMGL